MNHTARLCNLLHWPSFANIAKCARATLLSEVLGEPVRLSHFEYLFLNGNRRSKHKAFKNRKDNYWYHKKEWCSNYLVTSFLLGVMLISFTMSSYERVVAFSFCNVQINVWQIYSSQIVHLHRGRTDPFRGNDSVNMCRPIHIEVQLCWGMCKSSSMKLKCFV